MFLGDDFLSALFLSSSLFPFTYKLLRVRAHCHVSIWEIYLMEKTHSKLPQPTFFWSSTWHTAHTRTQLPAQESNLPCQKHIRNSSSARQQQLFPTHILKSRETWTASSLPTADQSLGHAGPALSFQALLFRISTCMGTKLGNTQFPPGCACEKSVCSFSGTQGCWDGKVTRTV